METLSRTVFDAKLFGCRHSVGNAQCCEPIINVRNATLCEMHFQERYNKATLTINRHWCLNHGLRCKSEEPEYVPQSVLQELIPAGRVGGVFRASGAFMLGHYCPACSVYNIHVVDEHTKIIQKSQQLSRLKRKVETIEEFPSKTEAQEKSLTQIHEAINTLERKRRALDSAENDISVQLDKVLDIIFDY